ncbi:serine hydrolase [Micromonospora parastrephiae]|uniref:serine hydrolase n=1 Tax=Micromonospora parastrephiae TaxID=2806101 RepID=UPI002815FAF4|nr:serine hydrolase [Micromonospora parastrephiae]
MTRLLTLIWRDEAGPAAACAMVRTWMARQIFWTRLAAGFPPGVRVSGKTGALPGLHLEAGAAEYPDGGRYAIAVFARADELAHRRIDVDLAETPLENPPPVATNDRERLNDMIAAVRRISPRSRVLVPEYETAYHF